MHHHVRNKINCSGSGHVMCGLGCGLGDVASMVRFLYCCSLQKLEKIICNTAILASGRTLKSVSNQSASIRSLKVSSMHCNFSVWEDFEVSQ